MSATVATVAYLDLEARGVEVQVQLSAGLPRFTIVGLLDNAVRESRERMRAALAAIGLALPKTITVNLSPADLPKEGSHYDLPIALCLLAAIGATDAETLSHYVAVSELCLDGRITASPGVLLDALHASGSDKGLICPAPQGGQASWAGELDVIAAPDFSPCWRISRAPASSHRRFLSKRSQRAAAQTWPRSKGRKSPSVRSRLPPPAATICSERTARRRQIAARDVSPGHSSAASA